MYTDCTNTVVICHAHMTYTSPIHTVELDDSGLGKLQVPTIVYLLSVYIAVDDSLR